MLLQSATVRDLDRLTARVVESTGRGTGCRLDAYRIDDTFFIDIELPGSGPAGIDITVDGQALTVRAERKPATVVAERSAGRQVELSDALDTDRLEARYDKGALTLSIPVKEHVAA